MLTIETERRVANFLMTLSEEEIKILKIKNLLINDYDFNPYECFKYLDMNSKESIDGYDIFNFMKQNYKHITLQESYLIILFYDTKDQNFWSYDNFVHFLACDSNISNFNPSYIYKNEINNSIKNLLLNIFESELILIKNTLPLVYKIKERYDYDIDDLFRSITKNCYIDKQNINEFLIRNGYINCPEIKLKAIINRLSLGKNYSVTLCDLKRLFDTGYFALIKNNLSQTNIYQDKFDMNNDYIHNLSGNEIKNFERKEYKNIISNQKEINNFNEKNLREELINTEQNKNIMNPKNYSDINYINNSEMSINKNINIYDISEEKYFINYLELISGIENLIEQKKIELTLRADFNIEDCIKIFKPNNILNDQFISLDDFIYGLQNLDLEFNIGEIKLLFRRYDLKNKGHLTFSNFFDMLVPFNRKYREMVENRQPMPYKLTYNVNEIFLEGTIIHLKNLLQYLCLSEMNIEKERYKLIHNLNITNLDKIFYKIDENRKGFITPNDLSIYFQNSNIDLDSVLIFIRMDKDRDGIITLNDIINEISLSF